MVKISNKLVFEISIVENNTKRCNNVYIYFISSTINLSPDRAKSKIKNQ